jgi:hypothetical protein
VNNVAGEKFTLPQQVQFIEKWMSSHSAPLHRKVCIGKN